jgi:uncharacterized damage-inducible protein DinB
MPAIAFKQKTFTTKQRRARSKAASTGKSLRRSFVLFISSWLPFLKVYSNQPTTHPHNADHPAIQQLIVDNLAALQQAATLLAELDDVRFGQAHPALGLSSVGAHLRHCLDFYQNFLAGLSARRINYDQRARDQQLEQYREVAQTRLAALQESLRQLAAEDWPIEVLLEGGAAQPEDSAWSRSSVKRELQFLLSHTIHHYSLMALALRLQGLDPGANFGVAPSTLQYWSKTA